MVLYEAGEIDVMEVKAPDLELVTDPKNPLSKELVRARPDFSLTPNPPKDGLGDSP